MMNKEVIPHVFSSLSSLERYLGNIQKILGCRKNVDMSAQTTLPIEFSNTENSKEDISMLDELSAVVKKMRRVANKLQLQFAKNEVEESVRSLRIFYGLNHMVRPEIIALFVRLSQSSNEPVKSANLPELLDSNAAIH